MNLFSIDNKSINLNNSLGSEHLLYISGSLWTMASLFFGSSTVDTFLYISASIWLNTFSILVICLLALKIIMFQRYTKKEFIIIIGVFLVLGVSAVRASQITLLPAFLFIIASQKINIKKFVATITITQVITISFIVLLAATNIIENRSLIRNGVLRYSLGFTHPNILGSQVLQFCVAWIVLRGNKINFFDYITLLGFNLGVYYLNDSNTSMYLIILLLLMTGIYQFLRRINQLQKLNNLFRINLIIWPSISVLLAFFYNPNNLLLLTLNDFTTGRLVLLRQYYEIYNFSLLGQEITMTSLLVLDNAYGYLGISFGILALIVFTISHNLLINRLIEERKYILLISIFIFIIVGFMEMAILRLSFNFTLIFLSVILYNSHDEPSLEGLN